MTKTTFDENATHIAHPTMSGTLCDARRRRMLNVWLVSVHADESEITCKTCREKAREMDLSEMA